VRRRFSEKDAALKLAQETRTVLQRRGYPVILTRDLDADIELNQRTAIANRSKAKIFVSLHLNASPGGEAGTSGVETYILNSASDTSSQRIADLENKGLDPTAGSSWGTTKEISFILKDFVLDANLKESKRLACSLQRNLTRVTNQKHRGVKQALFVVLLGADMPSALVEAGFVTSPKDRGIYGNPARLKSMAHALADAIDEFRRQSGTEAGRQAIKNCL
jgi:N-acetylmuramoyl-L-alanine amidase